jgi:uncharacterized delta-60 repeat protein
MWFTFWRNSRRSADKRTESRQPRRFHTIPPFRPHLEALEDRCLLSGGVLDPTFGTAGVVLTSVPSSDQTFAVATYPKAGTANDGKIVEAGMYYPNRSSTPDILRYNLDGSLDASFGGNGQVTNAGMTVHDVTVQPDGKIVAAGTSGQFAVVRYNVDGSLDTSFGGKGGKGEVTTAFTKNSGAQAERIALQTDGKILVAGWTVYSTSIGWVTDLALVRYNLDGSLDAAFGTGGKVTEHFATSILQGTRFWDMAIDPGTNALDPNAGKIVVVANLNTSGLVVRFNTNGSLDTSFGGAGYVTAGTGSAFSVAVQSDDRIVVAEGYLGVARFNPDGTPDATFGSGGIASPPSSSSVSSVTIQPDGKLVVDGPQYNSPSFMVARYNAADGSLDTSFGVNGIAVSTGTFSNPVDMALEPDGRIVVAGTGINGSGGFALVRFLPAGPQVGSFTASPNPVTAGGSETLSASNLTDGNPNSTITQVAFYQDANGDGLLEPGTDTFLGYGFQTSPGVWTFTFSTSGLTSGTYTLFAQAEDSYGVFGDPLAITATVN